MDNVTPQDNENGGAKRGAHTSAGFGISDKELAKQDKFQQRLTLAFDWIVAHKVLIIMLIGVLVLSGGGVVAYKQVNRQTQLKIQDQYFSIEKDYLKIKNDFDEADRQAKADAARALEKKADKKKKDEKEESKPAPKVQASGDMEKDYGAVVKRFSDLHSASPKSMPGKIASLMLADIYSEHKKLDLALQALEKSSEPTPKDLVDFMIVKKWASTQLSLGNFDQVIKKNQALTAVAKYPFFNSFFKLQMGLAHEGLKQWDLAESYYKDVAGKGNEPPPKVQGMDEEALKNRIGSDQTASELAQKYLLLLRMKKSESQAGT